MKNILSFIIMFVITTVFVEPVVAQHYARIVKETESIDKHIKYESGHIFETEIDTTSCYYIHILKGDSTEKNIKGGVVDNAKFKVEKYNDDIKRIKFRDKTNKLRYDCFKEAELVIEVEGDFFKKDAIELISKSEYDSILNKQNEELANKQDNVKGGDSDETESPKNQSIWSFDFLSFLGGIIIILLVIICFLFIPSFRKKKTEIDETNNTPIDSSSSEQEAGQTPHKTVPKLSWREKLGCFLAKDILERNEAQINKLNECKEQNSETIDELKKQIEDKDKEANEHTEKIQQLQNDNKKLKDEELPNSKTSGKQEENKAILEKIKSKFIDLKDVMTIDEALKKIIEAIENYKKKVSEADDNVKQQKNALNSEYEKKKKELEESNSKRRKELDTEFKQKEEVLKKQFDSKFKEVEYQQKVAEKAYNEAKSLSDSAEQRIKEIEASDKGVLTTKLEQIQGELNDSSNQVTTLNTQIDDLNSEINNYKKQISSLQSKLTDEQKAHQKTKETNKTEREQLNVSHKAKLKEKENEYQSKVGQLKDEHQNELANINDAHQKELKKKDEDHLSEITQEKQKAEDRETKLKDVISSQKSSISELETKLQIESDLLRNEAVQITETLCQFLKDNEIMAACNDDYKDKVEEKLQDVVYEAEQMYQAIKGLPQTKTPSEWVETLTKLLTQQMEENTSLLNRVLKYYAMSNVPFMIDSERGNGIYFIRKHMSQAYDYINSILAQCGIVPIIPAAFVENKDEGHYEVEGQFNDIESFCPGNMSEHLEHIERSSQSQSDMIIGITRVGYIIKNKKIIKAQVITK